MLHVDTGTVKHHNECKRHIASGTGFFNGIKITTAFKCIFEESKAKLSVNFGNHIPQDSTKNQRQGPRP